MRRNNNKEYLDTASYEDSLSTQLLLYYSSQIEMDSEEDEVELQRKKDLDLFEAAVTFNDAAAVQQALQNGANVNCYSENHDDTPFTSACERGNDDM